MPSFSSFNIFSRIRNSDKWFIVNLLSENADILTASEAQTIGQIKNGTLIDDDFTAELVSRGYIADTAVEEILYREKYNEFLKTRESDEIQLFFVPGYNCNFSCSYCYQDQYINPGQEITREIIDSFFEYISVTFAGRKKYITVFGGEPLLPGKKQKEIIEYIIERSSSEGIDICIVTNGFWLEDYINIFKKGKIREVQVTLDGTGEVHNRRRHLKNGGPTFDRIVAGIDACLEAGMPVNLRMVADRENIDALPALATFAINKGWTSNPGFKTQIGRNYELHHCQTSAEKLFDRVSLYERIAELIRDYPHISEFHKPAYSITRFLHENGRLPQPLFDSCPGCKTEWAFDYTGRIYSCTATVGKSDECLGSFWPETRLDQVKTGEWIRRDVLSISECTECSLRLACGGGCASVARNRTGKILSPDCRPVRELLEIGFSEYFIDR